MNQNDELTGKRYHVDRSYRSQIDKQENIDSGITKGTREAGHTDILRHHLRSLGIDIPEGHEPHHLVPKNDPGAAEAREILERNGIHSHNAFLVFFWYSFVNVFL